jgi:hypothetical protein
MRRGIADKDSTGGRGRRALKRLALASSLAALSLVATTSPSSAAVTIGQLAPESPPPALCTESPFDTAQPTVTSGNSYVVPANGTITSWSHNAAAGAGQMMKMKIFRPLGGVTYMVVGHDGPRDLTGGVVNTFPANILVKPGDVLGLNNVNAELGPDNACIFSAADSSPVSVGDLADGETGTLGGTFSDSRVNISAVFSPQNTFSLGDLKRNKKKGTATLTFNFPNPGDLSASGTGVQAAGVATISKAVGPGAATLLIKATGKKKRKLKKKGKAKVTVAITYTPTGGDPRTQSQQVRLQKKLKKKV